MPLGHKIAAHDLIDPALPFIQPSILQSCCGITRMLLSDRLISRVSKRFSSSGTVPVMSLLRRYMEIEVSVAAFARKLSGIGPVRSLLLASNSLCGQGRYGDARQI